MRTMIKMNEYIYIYIYIYIYEYMNNEVNTLF